VSHAAVKSFYRRGVSCKNARTVQFSGGGVHAHNMPKQSKPVQLDYSSEFGLLR